MEAEDVIASAKNGEPEAWRILYRLHGGRLIGWLGTRPTGDSVCSAEDVAHDAWLVAAARIADFEGTVDDFGGWLFGIARKSSQGARRRTQRRRTAPSPLQDDRTALHDPTLTLESHDWVRHVLAELPPRERDVVGLIDGLGFDTQGAAAVLGISAVAVRVARHRGLRRLRSRYGGGEANDAAQALRESGSLS